MFINKFNKLIRNKWIWGIFAFLVCFLFVASDLFSGGRGAPAAEGYGTLEGEAIPYEVYQQAYMAVRIEDLIRNRGAHEADGIWVDRRAWRYVAALRTAANMNLRVSESELNQCLKSLFSNEAGFQPAFYARFLMEQFHATESQFEAALSKFLLVEKVISAHALAGWVSEPFARAQSYGLTDTYTVRTATLTDTFGDAPVELNDEKLQEFYQRNLSAFAVPEKVAVRFVTFKVADFTEKAEADSEEDLQFRYDSNPSLYTGEVDGVKTNLTFEQALPQLQAESKTENAKELALRAAEDFTDAFYNDGRDEDREAEILAPGFFEVQAQAAGLTVVTTALFAAGATIPGVEDSVRADFTTAAFELAPDTSYECRSDAIEGKEAIYILAWQEKVAAHNPELDSIRAELTTAATQAERAHLFSDKAEEVYSKFTTERQKGRAFDEVTAELGLTTSTNLVVSPMDVKELPGDRRAWMTILPNVNAGKASGFVHYAGAASFIEVLERTHGDETMVSNYKGYLSSQMGSRLMSRLSDSWLEFNYTSMNPVVPNMDDEEL